MTQATVHQILDISLLPRGGGGGLCFPRALTSAITFRVGLVGVTDKTGIFAEDSGSSCGTGGISLSSTGGGEEHVHDVLGRVSSVAVDFTSLVVVGVPPDELGLEGRIFGEFEPFIVTFFFFFWEERISKLLE